MIGRDTTHRGTRARLRAIALASGMAGVIGVAGCKDKSVENLVGPIPTVTVATFKDSTFDFSTLITFAMPDTVVHFTPATGTPLDPSRQFDHVALERVRQDLLARGYTEIANPRDTTPTFVVLVGATATTNYNAFIGYPFFTVWGFYPGWGFYAPGFNASWTITYPWYVTVGATAYDRGTMTVDIVPTRTINPLSQSITSAWTGVATALLNVAVTDSTVTGAIDEMFRQSPYLTAPAPIQH